MFEAKINEIDEMSADKPFGNGVARKSISQSIRIHITSKKCAMNVDTIVFHLREPN